MSLLYRAYVSCTTRYTLTQIDRNTERENYNERKLARARHSVLSYTESTSYFSFLLFSFWNSPSHQDYIVYDICTNVRRTYVRILQNVPVYLLLMQFE